MDKTHQELFEDLQRELKLYVHEWMPGSDRYSNHSCKHCGIVRKMSLMGLPCPKRRGISKPKPAYREWWLHERRRFIMPIDRNPKPKGPNDWLRVREVIE